MNTLKCCLLLSLVLVAQANAEPQIEGKPKVPGSLDGQVNGEQLFLYILPEGAAPLTPKLKGTRFINVEPGCIMLEAYVRLIGETKLEIHMPHDDGFTTRTMEMMGVGAKRVVVTFKPSEAPNLTGSILAITASETKSSEQGGADQPATAPESKPENDSNPKPESDGRSR